VSASGVATAQGRLLPHPVIANIILTVLIVVRLLWMSRQAKQFASSESAKQYVLIAAMV
jgi:hypothetical protein